MYDESTGTAYRLGPAQPHHHHYHHPHQGHWYDEPPYESDPDDFLMAHGPAATIQVG